jgi:Zn-dependent membrane protease YugP
MYLDATFILLIPAMVFAFIAQGKVNNAYNKYAKIRSMRGMSGAQAARAILDRNGLSHIGVEMGKGRLSDHYDPRKKIIRLSPEVHDAATIASVSIAAHEAGHAVQHANRYVPLVLRNTIVPVVSIGSFLSWPLIVIGIFLVSANHYYGELVLYLGVIFFVGVVVFHAITLPVEFNASNRALAELEEYGIIYSDERKGVKKVLSAAAMTYVAALAVAVANLLRILIILRGRN